MKIAIMESILTPGGHEVDFDRIIVEEMQALGHEVEFFVPEQFPFRFNYKVPVNYLPGKGISYEGKRGIRKTLASLHREINRQRWYRALYRHACQGDFDAVIIPTSTYRYLRALNMSALKKSPVPVIFIVHGINPQEADSFFDEVKKLQAYPNIKMAVLTFGQNVLGQPFPNVYCVKPPVYSPRDCEPQAASGKLETLRLGFFGQYRKEKNLEAFLDSFLSVPYNHPVELFVQGATMNPVDAEDFERIIHKYQGSAKLRFLHKGLHGREWQEAILLVDALIMPYSAKRYLYHWAAMLFTAIGYRKPVVVSENINPEVLDQYTIGMTFNPEEEGNLTTTLREFINTYSDKAGQYAAELQRANEEFSPRQFTQKIAVLAGAKP